MDSIQKRSASSSINNIIVAHAYQMKFKKFPAKIINNQHMYYEPIEQKKEKSDQTRPQMQKPARQPAEVYC